MRRGRKAREQVGQANLAASTATRGRLPLCSFWDWVTHTSERCRSAHMEIEPSGGTVPRRNCGFTSLRLHSNCVLGISMELPTWRIDKRISCK